MDLVGVEGHTEMIPSDPHHGLSLLQATLVSVGEQGFTISHTGRLAVKFPCHASR